MFKLLTSLVRFFCCCFHLYCFVWSCWSSLLFQSCCPSGSSFQRWRGEQLCLPLSSCAVTTPLQPVLRMSWSPGSSSHFVKTRCWSITPQVRLQLKGQWGHVTEVCDEGVLKLSERYETFNDLSAYSFHIFWCVGRLFVCYQCRYLSKDGARINVPSSALCILYCCISLKNPFNT